jgi:hypothetical protein
MSWCETHGVEYVLGLAKNNARPREGCELRKVGSQGSETDLGPHRDRSCEHVSLHLAPARPREGCELRMVGIPYVLESNLAVHISLKHTQISSGSPSWGFSAASGMALAPRSPVTRSGGLGGGRLLRLPEQLGQRIGNRRKRRSRRAPPARSEGARDGRTLQWVKRVLGARRHLLRRRPAANMDRDKTWSYFNSPICPAQRLIRIPKNRVQMGHSTCAIP